MSPIFECHVSNLRVSCLQSSSVMSPISNPSAERLCSESQSCTTYCNTLQQSYMNGISFFVRNFDTSYCNLERQSLSLVQHIEFRGSSLQSQNQICINLLSVLRVLWDWEMGFGRFDNTLDIRVSCLQSQNPSLQPQNTLSTLSRSVLGYWRYDTRKCVGMMMMMIAFITIKSSLVPLIECLCPYIGGMTLESAQGALRYGVATIGRLLKITGLFCKRAL